MARISRYTTVEWGFPMSRTPNAVPVYRLHKPTKQAVCTVRLSGGGRRDLYLGKYNSPASRIEFGRIVALVAANGGLYPSNKPDITINELILAYFKFATAHYREPDGTTSRSVDNLRYTFRKLKLLFGPTSANDFGPKSLKAIRDAWIGEGIVRRMINTRAGSVKRMFKWAASEEMIPAEVFHRLQTVEGIRAGRTDAPDRPPVRPAVMADVEKALHHMPETVGALVLVQIHSGARAGELVKLRVGDIDRTDPTAWMYRPGSHKGTWRGKARVIYFGQRCRDVLTPLILKAGDPAAYLFSPARSEEQRNADRSENRVTPKWESHINRNERKRVKGRKRAPGQHYTTCTFRRAIMRACEAAGVPKFTPHRLRHLAATRVRAELGVDSARALLGHSLAAVTELYSHEVDKQLAMKAVEKFG
jgi:integrase